MFSHVSFKSENMLFMLVHIVIGNLQCLGKAYNSINILRAAAHIAFLCSSIYKRVDFYIAIDVQKSNAFGSVKFVRCTGNKMNWDIAKVNFIMPHGLHRIAMKYSIVFCAKLGNTFQREQVSYFVVGMHERNQAVRMFC